MPAGKQCFNKLQEDEEKMARSEKSFERKFTLEVQSVIRGHHVYKSVWSPIREKCLSPGISKNISRETLRLLLKFLRNVLEHTATSPYLNYRARRKLGTSKIFATKG